MTSKKILNQNSSNWDSRKDGFSEILQKEQRVLSSYDNPCEQICKNKPHWKSKDYKDFLSEGNSFTEINKEGDQEFEIDEDSQGFSPVVEKKSIHVLRTKSSKKLFKDQESVQERSSPYHSKKSLTTTNDTIRILSCNKTIGSVIQDAQSNESSDSLKAMSDGELSLTKHEHSLKNSLLNTKAFNRGSFPSVVGSSFDLESKEAEFTFEPSSSDDSNESDQLSPIFESSAHSSQVSTIDPNTESRIPEKKSETLQTEDPDSSQTFENPFLSKTPHKAVCGKGKKTPTDSTKKKKINFIKNGLAERLNKIVQRSTSEATFLQHKLSKDPDLEDKLFKVSIESIYCRGPVQILKCTSISSIASQSDSRKLINVLLPSKPEIEENQIIALYPPLQHLKIDSLNEELIICKNSFKKLPHSWIEHNQAVNHQSKSDRDRPEDGRKFIGQWICPCSKQPIKGLRKCPAEMTAESNERL